MFAITPLTTQTAYFSMPESLFLDNFATATRLGFTPAGDLVVYRFTNGLYAFLTGSFSTPINTTGTNTINGYAVKSSYAGIVDVLLVSDINMSYSSFQSYTQSHTTSVMLDQWMASGVLFNGGAAKNLNSTLIKTGNGNDQIHGIEGADSIESAGGDDLIFGNGGNDSVKGGAGNDYIDGGTGINTTLYQSSINNYILTKITNGFTVTDLIGVDGIDTLTNIERLHFSDVNVALDLNGYAGQVAKILGAVFGASSVSNQQYVGIGLSYLDGGMSYQDLMQLALTAKLGAGVNDPTQVVNLLYTNVVGVAPDQASLNSFVGLLISHVYTTASLGVMAADTSLNTTNINLVGLAQTGIDYV